MPASQPHLTYEDDASSVALILIHSSPGANVYVPHEILILLEHGSEFVFTFVQE
jgi:hypothetical protein